MNEKIEIVGKVIQDPYGSWEDCSPGLYFEDDEGTTGECIAGNNGHSMFGKYDGQRIRVTIEVLPDLPEPKEDEPTINFTFGQISTKGAWQDFCDWKGINEWCMNEGRADGSEKVEIPISKAKELGLI